MEINDKLGVHIDMTTFAKGDMHGDWSCQLLEVELIQESISSLLLIPTCKFVCVCVCVCVCMHMRARVCACMCVCVRECVRVRTSIHAAAAN